MRKNPSAVVLILVALAALSIKGCVVDTKETKIAPQIVSQFQGQYKVDPYFNDHKPKIFAVLPFKDKSESQKGAEIVRRGFYNHFSSLPYRDIELYRVDLMLKKAGQTDIEAIYKMSPQELGKVLGVDAVIYGEISDFDKFFAAVYSQVSVGAEVKIYETKTGHFLWSGQHVARIHEGGLSATPIGIIAAIVSTTMNVRDIQLLRACDDLFRDMVKTIPTPNITELTIPPVITLLTQDTKNLPKKSGDEIKVVIQGDPKKLATFDIGDFKKAIEMQEVEPGGYLGVYKVLPGDNVKDAIITGHLTDGLGNVADWVDAIGTVTLDTIPPEKPAGFTIIARNNALLMKWSRNNESDLAGYRVFRSTTPLSGFTEIARSEVNEFKDQGLVNTTKYYYKISAVDLAGNESEKSDVVPGMPVAPGPVLISGDIEMDTVWHAGSSPYIIESQITVKDKAVLKIEPGTEILSKGMGIVVEGELQAEGDKDAIIKFDGFGGAGWAGIAFVNVREKENFLRFTRISHAGKAIFCQASSPKIENNEITENSIGIYVSGAFSKPEILLNTIHKNAETGISVVSGSRPKITGNLIRDNGRNGLLVLDAGPVLKYNSIIQNKGPGISVVNSQADISENNIYDNQPLDLVGSQSGVSVMARNNWWGTANGLGVLSKISGRVDVKSVLTGPYPEGRTSNLPILDPDLGGTVKSDAYLILSNSPYTVKKDLNVEEGAILFIEPGVRLNYDQGTSIIVQDGGIVAKGQPDRPIIFTGSGAAPAPGSYSSAVKFYGRTKASSFVEYCVIKYADIGLDVHYGTPAIFNCHIAQSAHVGIFCRNDSAPRISYSTFSEIRGRVPSNV